MRSGSALRISTSLLYPVGARGSPQQTAAGPVTDADLLKPPAVGFGCCLSMNEPIRKNALGWPDLQVPWAAPAVAGHGLFLLDTSGSLPAIGDVLEGLTVTGHGMDGDNYGQAIGMGAVIDFEMRDVSVLFGAQGLGGIHVNDNSYPVAVSSLKYFSRSGIRAYRSSLQVANVFVAGTPCDSVAKLFGCQSVFDNWAMGFEGGNVPSDSYFWASVGDAIGGPAELTVRDCMGARATPGTAGIRLVSNESINAGLAVGGTVPAWCTIERSFNTFFPDPTAQALVAVDGPLWQGLYTGLPPANIPLALNTATIGGSARIGIAAVPAPVAPPPVAQPGTDPVLALPGLIGYYRADALPTTARTAWRSPSSPTSAWQPTTGSPSARR